MYARLQVRGGGVVIRKKGEWELDMKNIIKDPGDPKREVLGLFSETALRGMLSYLLGDIEKVHNGIGSEPLFDDPLREGLLERAELHMVTKPSVETFFARRAAVAEVSTLRINSIGWDKANILLRLWKEELREICQATSLQDVHTALTLAIDEQYKLEKEAKKEDKDAKTPNYNLGKLLRRSLRQLPAYMSIKSESNAINTIINYLSKLENYFNTFEDGSSYSNLHIELCAKVLERYKKDESFAKVMDETPDAKWSLFTSPKQTKHWADFKLYKIPLVEGAPMNVVNVDFDVVIPAITATEKRRILKGPLYASWGEGGFVELDLMRGSPDKDYPIGPVDSIYVEFWKLRKGGVKMRITDWENKEIERKKKEKAAADAKLKAERAKEKAEKVKKAKLAKIATKTKTKKKATKKPKRK